MDPSIATKETSHRLQERLLIVDDEGNMRQSAHTIVKKPLEIDRILELPERILGRRASGDLRKPALHDGASRPPSA